MPHVLVLIEKAFVVVAYRNQGNPKNNSPVLLNITVLVLWNYKQVFLADSEHTTKGILF